MVILLNSAVMPTEGTYTLKRISKETFRDALQEAAATGDFQSYIGYPETARLIEQLSGVKIEVSRAQTELTKGDVLLIVKLHHRIQVLPKLNTYQPALDDLEFFICHWQPFGEGETFE